MSTSLPRVVFDDNFVMDASGEPNSSLNFSVASLVFRFDASSCTFSVWSGSSFEVGVNETLGCDPFSRVGACGRRPSESADPGASASWVLYREW